MAESIDNIDLDTGTEFDMSVDSPEKSQKMDDDDASFFSPILTSKSNSSNTSMETIINSRISQILSVTPRSDVESHKTIEKIKSTPNMSTKLSSLLDYLIEKSTNSALDFARTQKELKQVKDDLKISENRSSRLLLHLQQNVKLLSRIATNEGETSLLQEANQNLNSVDSIESIDSQSYASKLKAVFNQKADPKLCIELMELLKQQISINTILRRQTSSLQETSEAIMKNVEKMKSQLSKVTSPKKYEQLKSQVEKQNAGFVKLSQIGGCTVDELENTMTQLVTSNKSYRTQIERISSKLKAAIAESESKITSLTEENERLKSDLESKSKASVNVQKARMRLCSSLGVSPKCPSDIDALVFAANLSVKSINEHRSLCEILGKKPGELQEAVKNLCEENEQLKAMQEQSQNILAKQAETIEELKIGAPSGEVSSNTISLDLSKESDVDESDIHFGELSSLKAQFSTIGKQLEDLQNQMQSKLE